jgi:excisionase family DNA binding protein
MTAVTPPRQRGASEPDTVLADLQRQLGLVLATLSIAPAQSSPAVPQATPDTGAREGNRPASGLDELPDLISVSKAANVLGISRASAYRYAAGGDLPTVRLGGRVYVVTARLRAFLEAA